MSALDAEQLPIANDNKQVTEKMKTLTTVEFEALIEHGGWQREQNYEIVERYDHTDIIPCYEKGKNEHVKTERRWGLASKKSTLGGITISYNELFSYTKGDNDSFSTSTDFVDDVWVVQGVTVIDEDGDTVDTHNLGEYFIAENEGFTSIDYSGLKTTD